MTPRGSNDSPAESTLHANTSVGSGMGGNTSRKMVVKSNLFDDSSGSVNTFGGIETENQGMFM